MADQKLLFKGHVLKPGDYVKAVNKSSGAATFYRVIRVWGSLIKPALEQVPQNENAKEWHL
jgi:hypothetical protein